MQRYRAAAALLPALIMLGCSTAPIHAGAALSASASPASAQTNASVGGVSAERLSHLARGINFGNLFMKGANPLRYASAPTSRELGFLRRAGFTFVRLPIDPRLLFNPRDPARLEPAIRYIDRAVNLILASGLSVVIDPIHTSSTQHGFEGALATDPAFVVKVGQYWRAIARRYANRDPNRVFFEIMNEPHASAFARVSPAWWPPVQERLARAIRTAAPRNTIIATGEEWGNIGGLLRLKPLPFPDVVYSFHFYQPFEFTHQGATWVGPIERALRGVPYPSSPAAVARLFPAVRSQAVRRSLLQYGRERWSLRRIRADIARAVAWANWYRVPLLDGEFGAFKPYAPAADRYRWLRDVRTVLEADHIGWAMWSFDTGFGLASYEYPGIHRGLVLDNRCLAALGLRQLSPPSSPSPVARFEEAKQARLALSVPWLGTLWTAQRRSGSDALAEAYDGASKGKPAEVARIVHSAGGAWVIRPEITLRVQPGDRYLLSARAMLEGPGSCELAVVTYYPGGVIANSSYDPMKVEARGRWTRLSSRLYIPPGVSRIALRWSGRGRQVVDLSAIELSKSGAGVRRPV